MERRYQMIRLAKGDYLLPSNDRATLWRLSTYVEDGSLIDMLNGSERAVTGTFWALWRRKMPTISAPNPLLIDEWDGWEFYSGPLRTRQEAIDEAMRVEEIAAMREP